MAEAIPESHIDLLGDDKAALAMLATTMPDGSPQVTPVWFNMDGDRMCINTARQRVEDRNMSARPQVVAEKVSKWYGKVVGINIARAGRVNSYAIPASVMKEIVQRLKK